MVNHNFSAFFDIDEEPIGSGAIAQVHKAKTIIHGKSKQVVIKLVHQRARECIVLDMHIFSMVTFIIESIIPGALWWSLSDEVKMFQSMMVEQLDMRNEARNLIKFRENFKTNHDIIFPEPYLQLSTRDMLVEEYNYYY
jgi:aarF domain-containing kinase